MAAYDTISNIRLIKLPKDKYEITWDVSNGKQGHEFLTAAGILSWANNGKIYKELRDFARELIRSGGY